MGDPYEGFVQDIQSSFHAARSLCDTFQRDGSTREELATTLKSLRQDFAEVRQTVRAVEQSGPARFGLSVADLERRKAFVNASERELGRLERVLERDDGALDARPATSLAWEQEQQQLLLANQDQALNQIGSSLTTLRSQAQLIGTEADEHAVMLHELDADVDRAQTNLQGAIRRMDRFVARADARLGGWCVWILIGVRVAYSPRSCCCCSSPCSFYDKMIPT